MDLSAKDYAKQRFRASKSKGGRGRGRGRGGPTSQEAAEDDTELIEVASQLGSNSYRCSWCCAVLHAT